MRFGFRRKRGGGIPLYNCRTRINLTASMASGTFSHQESREGQGRVRCKMRSCWLRSSFYRPFSRSDRANKLRKSSRAEKRCASTVKVVCPPSIAGDKRILCWLLSSSRRNKGVLSTSEPVTCGRYIKEPAQLEFDKTPRSLAKCLNLRGLGNDALLDGAFKG